MSEDLKIKVSYEVDESALNKSLAKVQTNTTKALSGGGTSGGGSGPQTAIDRSILQAGKLQDHLKMLQEAHGKLSAQPGFEKSLAKVNQEMAGIFGQQKRMSTGVTDYISNLQKQVKLQEQARNLMNNADGGSNQYSAHSQRQMAMLQQITGQVPGGGILNKFLSGAGRAAGGGIEGEGAGLLSRGGLAGGAMAAAAGAAALAIGALVSKEMELAARSAELAQSAGSATSQLGQLRSQLERTAISKDLAATSPNAISIAGIKSWAEQQGNNFFSHLLTSPQDRQKGIDEKIKAGLGGDSKEQWRRTLEQGQDLNTDLARQKQALSVQQFRQDRDFALDLKQFSIDTANTKFDLQKNAQRQEQDYQLSKAQFDENFQGKMAAKQFAYQKQYALQDYQISRQDKAYDFGVSRQRATQDYTLQRQDKAYDFNVSQGRNQEQFNISQGRAQTGRRNQLFDMAMGGANGLQYLQASRDFNQQQQYAKEDFQRQKKYSTQDYAVGAARDARGFLVGQDRSQADFNLSNTRDARQFGIANQRMDTSRQMQIDAEDYSRKYAGIQLQLTHNRALQDSAIALSRFNQSVGMQTQRFANQAGDIGYDQGIQNQDFALSSYRSLRGQNYNQQDLAGAIRKSDPLGAYGQSLTDPTFAAALAANQKATGQAPLAGQVQAAQGMGPGSVGGHFLSDPGGALGDIARFLTFGADQNQGKDKVLNAPMVVNFNTGSPTFAPGASQTDLDQANRMWADGIAKLGNDIMAIINKLNGG
jgi:hypothetical protein